MKQRYALFAWFLLPIISVAQNRSQNQVPDTGWLKLSIANAASTYYDRMQENAPFYNGVGYTGYGHNINGHPFFQSDMLQKASFYYDGTLYENIPLLYDLVSDEVVIKDYTNNYYIRLNSSKIRYFSLLGHTFIRQVPDSNGAAIPELGFFDRIYEGPTTVFAKRKKQISHTLTSEKTISEYVQYNSWYIRTENGYSRITGKKSLLSILNDKKSELKKWLSKEKLDFKKNMDDAIKKTVAYYDQISKAG